MAGQGGIIGFLLEVRLVGVAKVENVFLSNLVSR